MAGAPALQRFRYDPNKPVEGQLQTFLAGRNPYGTAGTGWMDPNNSQYFNSTMNTDEGGNTSYSYSAKDPDVQYTQGADSPYTLYGRYGTINWRPTDDPNGIADQSGQFGGKLKPDDMYDYNNLYYDPKFGLVRDVRDVRDPHAKTDAWTNAAIMAVVGGAGFGAAGAADAAAGGSQVFGQGIPRLASTGLNVARTADSALNPGDPRTVAPIDPSLTNLAKTDGGNTSMATNPALRNPGSSVFGQSADPTAGVPKTDPTDPNAGGDPSAGGGGDDLYNFLGSILTGAGGMAASNKINQGYRDDINHMIDIGTGGVTNDDRSGARNLVKGVYDGSISGDAIFDKVPGLRALSDRGAADIGRQMAAHGDSDPQSSARMREFTQFNNDLTSKAWDSEMNRAMKVGGYDINPSAMAGQGMRAIGDIYGNQRQDLSGLAALLSKGAGPGGLAGGIGSVLRSVFGGNGSDAASIARSMGLKPTDPNYAQVMRILDPNFQGTYTGGEDSVDPFNDPYNSGQGYPDDMGNGYDPSYDGGYTDDPGYGDQFNLPNLSDTFNMDTFDPAYFGTDIYG